MTDKVLFWCQEKEHSHCNEIIQVPVPDSTRCQLCNLISLGLTALAQISTIMLLSDLNKYFM